MYYVEPTQELAYVVHRVVVGFIDYKVFTLSAGAVLRIARWVRMWSPDRCSFCGHAKDDGAPSRKRSGTSNRRVL